MAMVPVRLFGGRRKRRRFVPMGTGGFRPLRRLAYGGLRARRRRGRRATAAGELKFFDLDVDLASILVTGTIAQASCNLIAQGADESERIGRKCTVRSILWRYSLTNDAVSNSSGAQSDAIVRVILYQDKQTNGATATVTGILESDNYQSFRNLTTTGRFKILLDRTHNVKHGSSAGDGAVNDYGAAKQQYRFYKDCEIPLEFSAGVGAITELTTNNIGVLLIAEATQNVTFDSKMRIRFSDN